jgi:predicted AlkP superfamily pyrophosphatase or phosphodiesterase
MIFPGASDATRAAERPRLLVVVSVDQLPFEYLLRMRRGFADDGLFETVRRDGAFFLACHHGQAFTITGPGHSTLLSGAYPNTTGIIENDWYDRRTGKKVYCVDDASVQTVGAPGKAAMSPRNMEVGTLGDQIKLASNGRGKVYGVALKDRASILMAGHMADGAFWYDNSSGRWVTSTYYDEALPDYLQAYNEADRPRQFGGQAWELLLPPEKYEHYYPDNAPWETNVATLGRSFPHPLPKADDAGYAKVMPTSPFGSEMTLEVARLVLTEEKLGADDEPDLLCINLSSNDYVGHAYGPYSLEAQDMTYRTDRMLAEFTKFLDERVGKGRWTFALSSDHGVAPIPEHAARMKLPGRRVSTEHFADLRKRLEENLVERFGSTDDKQVKYVEHFDSNSVYLNHELPGLEDDGLAEAQRAARDLLLNDDAVAAAFTRDELIGGGNETELFRRVTLSFHQVRSGDVLFVLKPYHIAGETAATHGSPWEYDTHVPLLMLGAGITGGVFDRPVAPPQIAPTFARLLGVDFPSGCTVEPLYDALAPSK